MPVAAMFVNGSRWNEHSIERTFHRCFYQVSVHLAKRFQMRRVSEEKIKMWKVNERRTPSDGKSSRCLWQGELKNSIYFGKNTFIIPYYAIDSVKHNFFVVHVIVFGRLKYIPTSVFRIYADIHGWRTNENLCNKLNP